MQTWTKKTKHSEIKTYVVQIQRGRFKLQSTQWVVGITRIHCHFADDTITILYIMMVAATTSDALLSHSVILQYTSSNVRIRGWSTLRCLGRPALSTRPNRSQVISMMSWNALWGISGCHNFGFTMGSKLCKVHITLPIPSITVLSILSELFHT